MNSLSTSTDVYFYRLQEVLHFITFVSVFMKLGFSTMKILLRASVTLLAVLGDVLCGDIKETGTEGSIAIITCRYGAGYEDYVKYFCKGYYRDCETLIKSEGKGSWTHTGRISLHDNFEQKKFVVTIKDLKMEDAGTYGCGIERTGQDEFTPVHLTVIKAPQPPKPPKPPQSTSSPTTVSRNKTHQSTSSPTTISSIASDVTNITGSIRGDTGNSTTPANSSLSAVGGTLGGVLLALAIVLGIIFASQCRTGKEETAPSQPNAEVKMEDLRLYEEIQPTNCTQDTSSATYTHQHLDPNSSSSDHSSNSHPPCITIYSMVNNHLPVSPSKELHSSNDPQYSVIHFINDKALDPSAASKDTYSTVQNVFQNQNPIYSVVTGPEVTAHSSDYSTVGLPHHTN